jgi:hypothetical protein
MTEDAPIVYELTLDAGRDSTDELDQWLEGAIDDIAARPGFRGARIWSVESNSGRATRVARFEVDDEARLRHFLDHAEPDLKADALRLFGGRVNVTSRVLRGGEAVDGGGAPVERCMNCDTVLTGQYCGHCGQRAQARLIRLPELIRDAFGDLFELDSRLWRTLVPLAFRPGRLTRDYLRGRRARYMPPFRMYLVLSLAFFLVAFFDPEEELGILFEDQPLSATSQTGDTGEIDDAGEAGERAERLADERTAGLDDGLNEAREQTGGDIDSEDDEPGIRFTLGDAGESENCELEDFDNSEMPGWLARRLTKERLTAACENIVSEDGSGLRNLVDRMVENIPAGLFILLPVMALVLLVLHPLSGRYYVEHLLFVIHYHSFVFLILSLEILFVRVVGVTPIPEAAGDIAGIATSIYIPVYLYKSMRRVYERGHLVTLLRFFLLVITYGVGLGIIVAIAALFAAFSV